MKKFIVLLGLLCALIAVPAYTAIMPAMVHWAQVAFYGLLTIFVILMTGSLIVRKFRA